MCQPVDPIGVSPATDGRARAGWGAVFGASLLGLGVAIAAFAVGYGIVEALSVDAWSSWLLLIGMWVAGGIAAGYRCPGGLSSAVGSALLVALWFGVAAFHLGIAIEVYGPLGFASGDWLVFSILWTPFALVLAGFGGLFGAMLAAVVADRRSRADADGPVDAGPIDAGSADANAPERMAVAAERDVPLGSILRASLEGLGVIFLCAVGGLFVGPLATVIGAPITGGLVAGKRSPGGAAIGVLCGFLAGIAYVVLFVVLLATWLRSLEYVAPGFGIFLFFFLLALLLAVFLSGIGGFLGGRMEAGAEPDAAAAEAPEP